MNSYINRVYEVHPVDGDPLIAKFYRPGRWSRNALRDELDFVAELNEDEIPVIPPLPDNEGNLLHNVDGIFFAVFPKKGGRIIDEPNASQWQALGRLVARVHVVGSRGVPRERMVLHPEHTTQEHMERILSSDAVSSECKDHYAATVENIIDEILEVFDGVETLRIHGDLHPQNLIHRPGESFSIIDFDDMALGPCVQDLWMLMPGRMEACRRELDLFLDGYETFREFPWPELQLVEPLRAMRYIHFTAWCVHQADDGGATRLAPDWGTPAYWQREIRDLEIQRDALEQ